MAEKIQLITLGCSKNRVDSEHLLKQIFESDIEISPEGEDLVKAGVDTLIINTCGFIKDAKEESVEAILEAVEAKRKGLIKRVLVFGCLSQRYRDELKEEIPEVDAFFGAFEIKSVMESLGKRWRSSLQNRRFLTTPSHYGYLKISEGCDRVCSYCSIPLIRGPHTSIPLEDLADEASYLAQTGVKELIVVAQDTTYYGVDLYKERRLANLLETLCATEGIEWVRLLYSYPAAFPESVLDVMATNPKMCKYLDIPLQHVNDKVLANMRRSVDGKTTRALIQKFRERVPGIVLRTTMIVGHPGESNTAFRELTDFISEAKFERLGAFTYSQEEGTWGAQNLKDSVSERIKNERYETLMELQSGISLDFNLSRVGKNERVLVDSFKDGIFIARSMSESPEVDGEILIGSDSLPQGFDPNKIIGTFVDVHIDNADDYDLIAKFIV
ncbi:MAG: 30S ribosomal protein S12 methylthiotransferase RimO [Bacteroidales bacterium]|jgi:ribosomal protein S12 methylthiotransferase|nr:30S ribosomal protein S12 methylthiotransferase RimO [Bacteroidales bacterium]